MAAGADAAAFDIKTNARQVLADLKEFDPALSRQVRKMLRSAGDDAITAMKDILDQPPAGVVTGKTTTRKAKRSRSKGSRRTVAAGLKMRVTTGKSRTTIRIVSGGGDLQRMYNARSWRHPVFDNRDEWVEQAGTRYFTRGAFGQEKPTYDRLAEAIQVALDAVTANPAPTP